MHLSTALQVAITHATGSVMHEVILLRADLSDDTLQDWYPHPVIGVDRPEALLYNLSETLNAAEAEIRDAATQHALLLNGLQVSATEPSFAHQIVPDGPKQ